MTFTFVPFVQVKNVKLCTLCTFLSYVMRFHQFQNISATCSNFLNQIFRVITTLNLISNPETQGILLIALA